MRRATRVQNAHQTGWAMWVWEMCRHAPLVVVAKGAGRLGQGEHLRHGRLLQEPTVTSVPAIRVVSNTQHALSSADRTGQGVDVAANAGRGGGRDGRVLQKPSVAEVLALTKPACAFRHNDERCAWINTGVVVFLPLAAGTLRALSRTALRGCTRISLHALHAERLH